MKEGNILTGVIIDVMGASIIIRDNGMNIPEQTYSFSEEDEWFVIYDRDGEVVLDGNIWWDEQWGFQYSEPEKLPNGNWQTGSDYRNTEIIFKDGIDTPITEVKWYADTMPNPEHRSELETETYDVITSIIQDDTKKGILKAEDRVGLKRLRLKLSWPHRVEKNVEIN